MKSSLILFLFILHSFGAEAESETRRKDDIATNLYRDGKYKEALITWYDLVNRGNTDPNLFFNIGSAESLLGHIPESILAFEKAARLRPTNQTSIDAIKKERDKMENAVIPVHPFFLIDAYRDALSVFRPGGWVLLGLVCILFYLLQWLVQTKAIVQIRIIKGNKKWFFIAAGIFFILIGLLSYTQLHREDEAIVMKLCDCRQAASGESPVIRALSAGEKVKVIDQIAEWNKVSLLNLDEGWVKTDCLKPIVIGTR